MTCFPDLRVDGGDNRGGTQPSWTNNYYKQGGRCLSGDIDLITERQNQHRLHDHNHHCNLLSTQSKALLSSNIINNSTLFASSWTSMLASAISFSYFRENQPYFAIFWSKLFPNVFQHLSWMKSFKSTRETLSKVESDSFYFP